MSFPYVKTCFAVKISCYLNADVEHFYLNATYLLLFSNKSMRPEDKRFQFPSIKFLFNKLKKFHFRKKMHIDFPQTHTVYKVGIVNDYGKCSCRSTNSLIPNEHNLTLSHILIMKILNKHTSMLHLERHLTNGAN
jgi:hypothetical protein